MIWNHSYKSSKLNLKWCNRLNSLYIYEMLFKLTLQYAIQIFEILDLPLYIWTKFVSKLTYHGSVQRYANNKKRTKVDLSYSACKFPLTNRHCKFQLFNLFGKWLFRISGSTEAFQFSFFFINIWWDKYSFHEEINLHSSKHTKRNNNFLNVLDAIFWGCDLSD